MKLRPRYSLLTLLILTAIVAGGVKLWHGPHHVVEQTKPEEEVEYSYTRDWRGERVIEGPRIERFFEANSNAPTRELKAIVIKYYRQGYEVPWVYDITFIPNYHLVPDNANEREFESGVIEYEPLTAHERAEYEQVIRRERVKLKPKERHNIVEYYHLPFAPTPAL